MVKISEQLNLFLVPFVSLDGCLAAFGVGVGTRALPLQPLKNRLIG